MLDPPFIPPQPPKNAHFRCWNIFKITSPVSSRHWKLFLINEINTKKWTSKEEEEKC
jgi:hypothetical protein